ncbi:hypothetical protein GCM10022198_16790 [Klugiella xanthotipulae]|uniref:DNA-binding beta-propeller fold protein YncE n=1 Tax=Klugiella xanthotipulae TaxID=244735 RepID=A0A543HHA8_9MICO|nr:hypothetical protein [Klugiella xanthotipulae]TQM57716.1 DNA-binding beta-propeller fold protein YncE [Klugiella xanthotipulae]
MSHVIHQPGHRPGLFHRGKRTVAAVAVAALTAGGLIVGGENPALAETASDTVETLPVTRDISFVAQRAQGLPGQRQVAHSARTGSLYVTSARGKSPVTTATLAKLDPNTLTVQAVADLPVIPHGSGETAGFKRLSPRGIAVDDTRGTVWVTNTLDDQFSVYDQETLDEVASSYRGHAQREQESGAITVSAEVNKPRAVIIDEKRRRAYISEAPHATNSISVYDADTFESVKGLTIPGRMDYPTPGKMAVPLITSFGLDQESGLLYATDSRTDEVYVINLETQELVKRIPITHPGGESGRKKLQASSVAINATLGELYVAIPGDNMGGWAGLIVYDLTTGAEKYSVYTGSRARAVAADTAKNLIYVADYDDGTVTVIDALSQEVIEKIDASVRAARHIVVADGSAYVVDNAGDFTDVEIPWGLDYATGAVGSATTEVPGYREGDSPVMADPRPINADGITKITPGAVTPRVYVQNTKSLLPGEELVLSGSGFAAGQQLTVTIDGDAYGVVAGDPGEAGAATTRGPIRADAHGSFTGEAVTLPTATLLDQKVTAPGDHTVSLRGSSPETSAQATFVMATAATCESASPPLTTTTAEGDAVFYSPAEVVVGEQIVLSGTGFKTSDKSAGSVGMIGLASSTGEGEIQVKNRTIENQGPKALQGYNYPLVHGVFQADDSGDWNISIPFPTSENSSLKAGSEWQVGQTYSVSVSTDNMAKGDVWRDLRAAVKVVAQPGAAPEEECVPVAEVARAIFEPGEIRSSSPVPFAGYPALGAQYRAPVVTASPLSVSVTPGEQATFTAAASGVAAPTVQWQMSADGTEWSDIVGAATSTLTLDNVEPLASGNRYRAVFTNSRGEAISEAATLLVNVPKPAEHETAAVVAPTVDDLRTRDAGDLTVTQTGSTVTVGNLPVADDTWVWMYGYPAAQKMGAHAVTGGETTVDVSAFEPGEHSLAVYDDATLLGYVPVAIAPAEAVPAEAIAVDTVVTDPVAAVSTDGSAAGAAQLTRTGAEGAGLIGFGLLVLLVGVGLVYRGRRRAADAMR